MKRVPSIHNIQLKPIINTAKNRNGQLQVKEDQLTQGPVPKIKLKRLKRGSQPVLSITDPAKLTVQFKKTDALRSRTEKMIMDSEPTDELDFEVGNVENIELVTADGTSQMKGTKIWTKFEFVWDQSKNIVINSNDKLQCGTCGLHYQEHRELRRHIYSSHYVKIVSKDASGVTTKMIYGEKAQISDLYCIYCDQRYTTVTRRIKHQSRCALIVDPCPYCGKAFTCQKSHVVGCSKAKLEGLDFSQPIQDRTCKNCGSVYAHVGSLVRHMKKKICSSSTILKSSESPDETIVASKSGTGNLVAVVHTPYSNGSTEFQSLSNQTEEKIEIINELRCGVCEIDFDTQKNYLEHTYSCHNVDIIFIDGAEITVISGQKTSTSTPNEKQPDKFAPINDSYPLCGNQFVNVKPHIIQRSETKKKDKTSQNLKRTKIWTKFEFVWDQCKDMVINSDDKLQCGTCGLHYKGHKELCKHIYSSHYVKIVSKDASGVTTKMIYGEKTKISDLYCIYCNKRYKTIKQRIKHQSRCSLIAEPCSHCGKGFNNLELHLKTCSKAKLEGFDFSQPIEDRTCQICGYVFALANCLLRHRKSCGSTQHWECEDCGEKIVKRFSKTHHQKFCRSNVYFQSSDKNTTPNSKIDHKNSEDYDDIEMKDEPNLQLTNNQQLCVKHGDELDEQLKALGLYRKPTTGNGNCMTNAISDQLYGNESESRYMRGQIAKELFDNPRRYEHFIPSNQTYAAKVAEIKKDMNPIDMFGLRAYSELKRVIIWLHQANLSPIEFKPENVNETDLPELHLAYHGDGHNGHYESVRKLLNTSSTSANIRMEECDQFMKQAVNVKTNQLPTPIKQPESNVNQSRTEHVVINYDNELQCGACDLDFETVKKFRQHIHSNHFVEIVSKYALGKETKIIYGNKTPISDFHCIYCDQLYKTVYQKQKHQCICLLIVEEGSFSMKKLYDLPNHLSIYSDARSEALDPVKEQTCKGYEFEITNMKNLEGDEKKKQDILNNEETLSDDDVIMKRCCNTLIAEDTLMSTSISDTSLEKIKSLLIQRYETSSKSVYCYLRWKCNSLLPVVEGDKLEGDVLELFTAVSAIHQKHLLSIPPYNLEAEMCSPPRPYHYTQMVSFKPEFKGQTLADYIHRNRNDPSKSLHYFHDSSSLKGPCVAYHSSKGASEMVQHVRNGHLVYLKRHEFSNGSTNRNAENALSRWRTGQMWAQFRKKFQEDKHKMQIIPNNKRTTKKRAWLGEITTEDFRKAFLCAMQNLPLEWEDDEVWDIWNFYETSKIDSLPTQIITETDLKLLTAVNKFGYGNWEMIAQQMETMNERQCKRRFDLIAQNQPRDDKMESSQTDSM